MKTFSIYVAHHRPFRKPFAPTYYHMQVGRSIASELLGLPGDDTGDNISHKNPTYCELTGMYWVWKNGPEKDYIGFCHYRRYFNFCAPTLRERISGSWMEERKITDIAILDSRRMEESIEEFFNKLSPACEIVLPYPYRFRRSMRSDYIYNHLREDWLILMEVLQEKGITRRQADAVFKARKTIFYPCNMFIMRNTTFNLYMDWLFDILSDVERRVRINPYPYQARVFGFMAERLLNFYVRTRFHKKQIGHLPILYLDI